MDRQTTLAFLLIGAVLMVWLYINSPSPEPPKPAKKPAVADSVKSVTTSPKPAAVKQEDSLKYGKYFSSPSSAEKFITIENEVAVIKLSTKGANIRQYYLKQFNNWYSAGEEDGNIYNKVQLINYSKGGAYDLAFVSSDGKAINTSYLDFAADKPGSTFKIGQKDSLSLTFTFSTGEGKSIQKTYTFYGSAYNIKSDIIFNGMGSLISNNAYDVVWNNGIRSVEHNSVDEANYSNASVFYGDEQVIVNADDDGSKIQEDYNGRIEWIGIRNKYFAAIIAPMNPAAVEGAYIEGRKKHFSNLGQHETYNARITVPFRNNNYEKQSFLLYIGPVDYDILKTYGKKLEAIVDFGSFFGLKFIVRPIAEYVLLPLFNFLHLFIPNYGFVIIVFSLIIKIVIYPLTKSSMQSMKKMQMLQPKMTEIKEKFKDDPQKMNKEVMKLYSTYGVNPAGGCLPLILQMPIFIALWGLFQVAIDLRQQPFMLWIHDLSTPDVIFNLPFKLPLFGVDAISGLALLMGITQFIQQKMTTKDPQQKALVYIMPVMLTIMFMSFPSGLNLYYFMFNAFSIAQQYYINHKHDGMVLEPVKNPKKSKGFMQKLMDAAEQNSKAQQQKKKR